MGEDLAQEILDVLFGKKGITREEYDAAGEGLQEMGVDVASVDKAAYIFNEAMIAFAVAVFAAGREISYKRAMDEVKEKGCPKCSALRN